MQYRKQVSRAVHDQGADNRTSRILLVGDDRQIGATLATSLGLDVVQVRNVGDAYDSLSGDRDYDVLVLSLADEHSASDLMAERMLDLLCDNLPDLPVLVIASSRDQGIRAVQRGVHGFVVRHRMRRVSFRDAASMAVELYRARRALRDANQRLIHADRLASIGQLTAGVAHELNNPASLLLANLTAMKDQLSGARDANHPGAAKELAARLREWADILDDSIAGVGQIRSIVRDLRTFSRVESDQVGSVDLTAVIEDACKLTDGVIRPRARLLKSLSTLSPVRGDHNKLVQVFTNLLTNAAQAIIGPRADNEIRVSAFEQDGLITAAVEDTGHGIPDDARKLVFEPFFTTKPKDVGNGLGLSLSAEIVHHHGGEIGFVLLDGGGTRFEVRLMVEDHPEQPRRASAPAVVAPASGHLRARILLVDDEPRLLRAFRRVLAPHHEVVMAANGQQALDILAQDTAFDGVVCDFSMPDIDGIVIYETVAARDRDLATRIVFCTGGPVNRRGRSFMETTRNTVLEKPVPPELLLGAIEQLGKR